MNASRIVSSAAALLIMALAGTTPESVYGAQSPDPASTLEQTVDEVMAALRKKAKEINADLPKIISSKFRLDSIDMWDNTVEYNITILDYDGTIKIPLKLKEEQARYIRETICPGRKKYLFDLGLRFGFNYHDNAGNLLFIDTIGDADCRQ